MTNTEAVFIWIAIWLYGFSFISYLYGLVFRRGPSVHVGWYIAVTGFVFQTASIATRWTVTGHPPVMRAYEMALLGSWLTLVLFGVLRHWHRRAEVVGVAVLPVILLMLGNGILGRPYLEPMAPPFKSNWLWLHVIFAWLAYGAFCIAAGLAVLYLLRERKTEDVRLKAAEEKGVSFFERLPELNILNDLMLRIIIFGFVGLTVQIGAGALWAYNLWGRYWGWDPIETWSLITWLIYGTYIHLGVTLGWKGRKMAWLAIASLISLFITYGGIGYMASVHMPMM